jgi:hypothetical protein
MTTKQVILVAVLAAVVHALCSFADATPAQASDPVTRDDVQRVVRALERIADHQERCR